MKYSLLPTLLFIAACTNTPTKPIESFADCKAAGYPIMESYPEQCKTPDGQTFVNELVTPPVQYTVETSNLRLLDLAPNSILKSGIIRGEARLWYFEASFPIEVRNAQDELILQTIATAQDNWMTEDWVPFEAQITLPSSVSGTGTLVFKKDNPSGEPEFDAEYVLPVVFE